MSHCKLSTARKLMVLALAATWGALPARGASSAKPNPATSAIKAGAAISVKCAVCHGSDGISADTNIPNLAGQHYQYLISQLEAYQDGTRKNPIMNEMAGPLSKEQMRDIAAYFSSIPIRVGSPPSHN